MKKLNLISNQSIQYCVVNKSVQILFIEKLSQSLNIDSETKMSNEKLDANNWIKMNSILSDID